MKCEIIFTSHAKKRMLERGIKLNNCYRQTMKITFDKEADASYVYFKDISESEVAKTISLNDSINIDLDKDGKTLGIEILDASKNLPHNFMKSAEIIG
ncbi:MAG: DUF2283 domain-containing protein [archaeon]